MTRAFLAPSCRPVPTRLVGWLPDGTPRYGPLGRVLVDGDHVCCHLCGSWFLSVTSHLRAHGWRKDDYTTAFGLERRNPLAGSATSKRRAAALKTRMRTEPAIGQAQREARRRARTGDLAAAAANANRGRRHSSERRAKTLCALASIRPEEQAAGTARRVRAQLVQTAAVAAHGLGHRDFAALALDRIAAGHSRAAISREAGLHKDWMSRHLTSVAPSIASIERRHPGDVAVEQAARPLGFDGPAEYLHARHVDQHRTVAAMARELAVSRSTIAAALSRHGIAATPHAGKRHEAALRDHAVAQALGHDSLRDYVSVRRRAGISWAAMACESGLTESTLRRRGETQQRTSLGVAR